MVTIESKDGVPITLASSGHGPPLVLVHGTAADHTRWAPILPALEAHFTVCAIDRRGRGASGDTADYRIDLEFDDVAAIIDSIGQPVGLLGHSHGGVCSLEAALRTKGVRRLVLYEPPIPAGVPLHPRRSIDRLQALLDAGDKQGVVTTFFTEIVRMPPAELKTLQSLPSWPARVAAAHTIPRELRADEGYRFDAARFEDLRAPTLLLLGGDSPAFFKAAIELVYGAVPSSRIAVLRGQRHTAMNTAPELFLREVLAFLQD
jgi:pimeloyl-ACP methyl ester carboxylesterase